MAVQIEVTGPVTVKVDIGDGLESLGISMDEITFEDQTFWHSVPSDEHGGPQGPEYDSQFLGRIVRIPVEFSRYDQAVFNKVKARLDGNGAAGAGAVASADIGALAYQGSKMFRVLLDGANDDFNFPNCKVIDAIVLNVGTKFSHPRMTFEAHRTHDATGAIWNTTTS